jgi:two-component system, NarL family, sensor histidine kinase EvgS
MKRADPRRCICLVLVVALLTAPILSVPAAHARPDVSLAPGESFYIAHHGDIRYVYGSLVPPFIFPDDQGRPQGIIVDLLRLMEIRLGIRFQIIQAANQSDALKMMANGTAELMGPISYGREATLDYTEPFVTGTLGFWGRNDRYDLRSRDDLSNRRIAVLEDSPSHAWLERNMSSAQLVFVSQVLEGLLLVDTREVDAYFGGFSVSAYYVQQEGLPLRPIEGIEGPVPGAWAVPEGNLELLSVINTGMRAVGREDLAAIYHKWTGYDLSPSDAEEDRSLYDNPWIRATSGVALMLVGLLVLWTFTLSGKVVSRTQELNAANLRLVHDLELRKQAEVALRESEARLRSVYDRAPLGILNVDAQARIVDSNQSIGRMLGFAPHELRGLPLDNILHPADLGRHRGLLTETIEGRRDGFDVEERFRRRDGSLFWARSRVAAIRDMDGRFLYTIKIVEDLTQDRIAEEAKHAAMIKEAENARLKEINAFKTQFFNSVAHELNTPLTPLRLQLDLLKSSSGGALNPRQQRSIEVLDRNIHRISLLVEEILDVARLQSGRLKLVRAPVDVKRSVDECVETFYESAKRAGVELESRLDAPILVQADPQRFDQILYNLVSNAIKFTPTGGSVIVEAEFAGPTVRLIVRDTGLGLTAEQIDKLFQPFTQVHDIAQTNRPGTGLGLYITKNLVELHGGRVWVESPGPGQGSTFYVELPLAQGVDVATTTRRSELDLSQR